MGVGTAWPLCVLVILLPVLALSGQFHAGHDPFARLGLLGVQRPRELNVLQDVVEAPLDCVCRPEVIAVLRLVLPLEAQDADVPLDGLEALD